MALNVVSTRSLWLPLLEQEPTCGGHHSNGDNDTKPTWLLHSCRVAQWRCRVLAFHTWHEASISQMSRMDHVALQIFAIEEQVGPDHRNAKFVRLRDQGIIWHVHSGAVQIDPVVAASFDLAAPVYI
jgi:hypothetical protein